MTNTVTVTEQNNTVSILEDAPIVTPDPWYQNLKTISTSSGSATVTADATPHTKGAWTEIIASNAAETDALLFTISGINFGAKDTGTLLDIATGAAGSETAVVENIAVGSAAEIVFMLPIKIASGARIAVRSQATQASDTATVEIDSYDMGSTNSTVPTNLDVLGTFTASSSGTSLTTSYAEVIASTSQEYAAIIIVESNTDPVQANAYRTIEVATGAQFSEQLIAEKNIYITSGEALFSDRTNASLVTQVTLPSGTRLSAKVSSGDLDCCVIGVPAA